MSNTSNTMYEIKKLLITAQAKLGAELSKCKSNKESDSTTRAFTLLADVISSLSEAERFRNLNAKDDETIPF